MRGREGGREGDRFQVREGGMALPLPLTFEILYYFVAVVVVVCLCI